MDDKRRSASKLAVDLDLATVRLDHLLGYVKAEAQPPILPLRHGALEAVEHQRNRGQ
jgi:hypothetical protein